MLENYVSVYEKMPIGEYKKARNLLYVAVTRAIKNLRVIYEGESGIVEDILAKIFIKKRRVSIEGMII